jgi:hypothetical protein
VPPADLTDYYPPWLGSDLLWDEFPWEAGITAPLSAFLSAYTLHDSAWVGLYIDPDAAATAIAVVRWDTFWTEGRVPFPGSAVAEWPFLLLRFTGLRGIQFLGYGGDDHDRSPRSIDACTSGVLDGPVHRTVFEDTYGGSVQIDHRARVDLLCLGRDRTPHAITLSPEP